MNRALYRRVRTVGTLKVTRAVSSALPALLTLTRMAARSATQQSVANKDGRLSLR
jgi:hypothetical protein